MFSESWNRILHSSSLVTVGTFDIVPSDPHFATAGEITSPVFVFPRTAVWIQHEGRQSFVADPSVVTYYNRAQPYFRHKLSDKGDHCDWFRLNTAILREVVRLHDPTAAEQESGPFPFAHGPSDARSYLTQRLVIRHLLESAQPDLLFVEETILEVFRRCVAAAFHNHQRERGRISETSNRRQLEIADRTKEILAERLGQALSLSDLAKEVDCSVFHLCRVFRARAGTTIHRHLSDLRLRTSLDSLDEDGLKLTQLALELGYSSHSHFTAAFKRAFGQPPSQFKHLSKSQVLKLLGDENWPRTHQK